MWAVGLWDAAVWAAGLWAAAVWAAGVWAAAWMGVETGGEVKRAAPVDDTGTAEMAAPREVGGGWSGPCRRVTLSVAGAEGWARGASEASSGGTQDARKGLVEPRLGLLCCDAASIS